VYWKYQYVAPRTVFDANEPDRSATLRTCSATNAASSNCAYAVWAVSESSVKGVIPLY
jgi:hypothetical protein